MKLLTDGAPREVTDVVRDIGVPDGRLKFVREWEADLPIGLVRPVGAASPVTGIQIRGADASASHNRQALGRKDCREHNIELPASVGWVR